jgi:DNA mismatch endonuclease, patch repair protein
MPDFMTVAQRRMTMSRVRRSNTSLEQQVAKLLSTAGVQFRQNARDLPGTPDFVLEVAPVVIFAHGCFWHGHHCRRGRPPATGVDAKDRYWEAKLRANQARDRRISRRVRCLGYSVLTIWACDVANVRRHRTLLSRVTAACGRKIKT